MRYVGNDLSCIRGGRTVFAGLSFDLGPGDLLLLTGANGSGKTTLLRLMAGLSVPAAGTLGWTDGAVRDDPEKHFSRIAYIGHADALKQALTGQENLSHWTGIRGTVAPERLDGALDRLGLGALGNVPVRYYSAGQRRRLALARLLCADAPLWLLDEPTIALDTASRAILAEMIAEHRRGGGFAAIATNVDLEFQETATLDLAGYAVELA